MTLCLAVSGGFVPFPKIPAHASWLQWFSPAKYTFQALSIAQFEGSRFEFILDEADFRQPATVGANIAVLALMYFVLSASTMLVLSTSARSVDWMGRLGNTAITNGSSLTSSATRKMLVK